MTKKKLTLEEKFDKLESKSVCLGQYFQITQIELEKKVLLRQLCDVRIRLKNLNRQKVRERDRNFCNLSEYLAVENQWIKTKFLYERLVRKFGWDFVSSLVPKSDVTTHKRLKNMRKALD